jgi:hypothetical protein
LLEITSAGRSLSSRTRQISPRWGNHRAKAKEGMVQSLSSERKEAF